MARALAPLLPLAAHKRTQPPAALRDIFWRLPAEATPAPFQDAGSLSLRGPLDACLFCLPCLPFNVPPHQDRLPLTRRPRTQDCAPHRPPENRPSFGSQSLRARARRAWKLCNSQALTRRSTRTSHKPGLWFRVVRQCGGRAGTHDWGTVRLAASNI